MHLSLPGRGDRSASRAGGRISTRGHSGRCRGSCRCLRGRCLRLRLCRTALGGRFWGRRLCRRSVALHPASARAIGQSGKLLRIARIAFTLIGRLQAALDLRRNKSRVRGDQKSEACTYETRSPAIHRFPLFGIGRLNHLCRDRLRSRFGLHRATLTLECFFKSLFRVAFSLFRKSREHVKNTVHANQFEYGGRLRRNFR
jgi:hypothetical protein